MAVGAQILVLGKKGKVRDLRSTLLPSTVVHGPKYVMLMAMCNILADVLDTGPGCYVNTALPGKVACQSGSFFP